MENGVVNRASFCRCCIEKRSEECARKRASIPSQKRMGVIFHPIVSLFPFRHPSAKQSVAAPKIDSFSSPATTAACSVTVSLRPLRAPKSTEAAETAIDQERGFLHCHKAQTNRVLWEGSHFDNTYFLNNHKENSTMH